ncbi:MAG: GNAT family N-acetyltransferase [Parvularculaceae bacterium]
MPHTLRTTRLLLRPSAPRDAPRFWRAIDDFDVVKMTSTWPYPLPFSFVVRRLRRDAASGAAFSVFVGERIAGNIGGMLSADGDFGVGYMFARPFWGRGYASETLKAYCDHIFAVVRPRAIVASRWLDNPASGRVLEKAGFADVGPDAPRWCVARRGNVAGVNYRLTRP